MTLILYSKPDCHLCEGLLEKLEQIQNDPHSALKFDLEIRDITTRDDWFQAYQYEVPVLFVAQSSSKNEESGGEEKLIPRPSPRVSVRQLEKTLEKYLAIA